MTDQESLYRGRVVYVIGIVSKSGKLHRYVRKYVGRTANVVRESKNNMLLLEFRNKHSVHDRAIPAGCVMLADDVNIAGG